MKSIQCTPPYSPRAFQWYQECDKKCCGLEYFNVTRKKRKEKENLPS
jgi:hypothetical protein